MVWGIQAKVSARDFRLWTLGFGLWALYFELWILEFRFWSLQSKCWILGFGLLDLGLGREFLHFLDCAFGILYFGLWALDLSFGL